MTTPFGGPVRIRLELRHLGDEADCLEQVVDAGALRRRNVHRDDVATVVLDDEIVLGELLLHPVGVRAGQVDLVDSNDDRHAGSKHVVDRLNGLRHDAVVRGDDEYGDIRNLGAAGAHGRERGVARRVDEGDQFAVALYLVGADVLGDAAGLAGSHARLADGVEEARLAVVNVAEDGDDWRPRLEGRRVIGDVLVFERGFGSSARPRAALPGGSNPSSTATMAAVS